MTDIPGHDNKELHNEDGSHRMPGRPGPDENSMYLLTDVQKWDDPSYRSSQMVAFEEHRDAHLAAGDPWTVADCDAGRGCIYFDDEVVCGMCGTEFHIPLDTPLAMLTASQFRTGYWRTIKADNKAAADLVMQQYAHNLLGPATTQWFVWVEPEKSMPLEKLLATPRFAQVTVANFESGGDVSVMWGPPTAGAVHLHETGVANRTLRYVAFGWAKPQNTGWVGTLHNDGYQMNVLILNTTENDKTLVVGLENEPVLVPTTKLKVSHPYQVGWCNQNERINIGDYAWAVVEVAPFGWVVTYGRIDSADDYGRIVMEFAGGTKALDPQQVFTHRPTALAYLESKNYTQFEPKWRVYEPK